MTRSAAFERFMASTNIDYGTWHDGEGYDLDALGELQGQERAEVQRWLLGRAGNDWRDLDALLALGSDTARAAVVEQLRHGKLEQRLNAAHRLSADEPLRGDVEAVVIDGLEQQRPFEGLTPALDVATELRTPAMVAALFRACLRDEGEAAVHAAARLAFIHGKAADEFDWDLRPLFLRFNSQDHAQRQAAFRDLCQLCGVDPEPYLRR